MNALIEKNEIFDLINSAVVEWSVDGRIKYINVFAQNFFGWSAEEAVGQPVGILVPDRSIVDEDLSMLISDIAANPDRYRNQTNENVCRDGRRVWFAWTNTALHDKDGNVTSIIAIGNDVTQLRLSQLDLHQANVELRNTLLMTVEREERMVELKREVNLLAAKLGFDPPYRLELDDM
jgi:PAS domain S-box-containing protein